MKLHEFLIVPDSAERFAVAEAIESVLSSTLTTAFVDAFTDLKSESLPTEAVTALRVIEEIGARRPGRAGRTGMGVDLDLADPRQREAFWGFIAATIHTEAFDAEGAHRITAHDTGDSYWLALTEGEAISLRASLAERGVSAKLTPYSGPPRSRVWRAAPVGCLLGGIGGGGTVSLIGLLLLTFVGGEPQHPGDPNDGAVYAFLGAVQVATILGAIVGVVVAISRSRRSRRTKNPPEGSLATGDNDVA